MFIPIIKPILLEPSRCPKCGKPASHALESVLLHTPITVQDDGSIAFDSNSDSASEVFWDSSSLEEDDAGYTLHCEQCRHSWSATKSDEEPETNPDRTHILIVVEGGCVSDVICDQPDLVQVDLLDHDNTPARVERFPISKGSPEWSADDRVELPDCGT